MGKYSFLFLEDENFEFTPWIYKKCNNLVLSLTLQRHLAPLCGTSCVQTGCHVLNERGWTNMLAYYRWTKFVNFENCIFFFYINILLLPLKPNGYFQISSFISSSPPKTHIYFLLHISSSPKFCGLILNGWRVVGWVWWEKKQNESTLMW